MNYLLVIGILLIIFGIATFWLTRNARKTTKAIADDTDRLRGLNILMDSNQIFGENDKHSPRKLSVDMNGRNPYDFTNITDLSAEYDRICAVYDDARTEISRIAKKIRVHEKRIKAIQRVIYELEDEEARAQKYADDFFDRISVFEDSPEWDAWMERQAGEINDTRK